MAPPTGAKMRNETLWLIPANGPEAAIGKMIALAACKKIETNRCSEVAAAERAECRAR